MLNKYILERLTPAPPLSLFFDAAGTLIELREPVGQTYASIAAKHDVVVSADVIQQNFRRAWKANPTVAHDAGPTPDDDPSWWQQLVAHTFALSLGEPLPESTLLPLFDELYHHFEQPDVWQLYPDVLPALQQLKPHYPLHVLSNFDRRLITILKGLGVHDFFASITLSSEVGASKPHPRIFAYAKQQAGVPAAQCLLIGDDAKCDAEGAQQAGWQHYLLDRPEKGLSSLVQTLSAL